MLFRAFLNRLVVNLIVINRLGFRPTACSAAAFWLILFAGTFNSSFVSHRLFVGSILLVRLSSHRIAAAPPTPTATPPLLRRICVFGGLSRLIHVSLIILLTLLVNFFHQGKINRADRRGVCRNDARSCLEFLNRIIWADQEWIRFNPHRHPMALLNLTDVLTLLID